MDELIGQLAAEAGVDNVVAEKTIGIRSEGQSDQVQALIGKRSVADAAIAAAGTRNGLGRLMDDVCMRAGDRPLMALRPGMDEILRIARELFNVSRDKIGAEHMGKIIAGTPGLSQFA